MNITNYVNLNGDYQTKSGKQISIFMDILHNASSSKAATNFHTDAIFFCD